MKKLGESKDGVSVYYHPEGHSHRPDLDSEVISHVTINERPFLVETITLDRVIGVDHLVETTDEDTVIGFRRGNRNHESRMVLNRTATETKEVTIILCKCGAEDGELNGEYALVTLFEGNQGRPEPYGKDDTPENQEFWRNHALIPTETEMDEIKKGKPSPSGLYIVSYWQCDYEDEYYGSTQEEVFNSYETASEYAKGELTRNVFNRYISVYTSSFEKGKLEKKDFIISYEGEYERSW